MPKPPPDPRAKLLPPPMKKSKDDDWTVRLRIRSYVNSDKVHLWLLKCNKGISYAILHGCTYLDAALLLGQKLGVPVEREESPLTFDPTLQFPEE